MCISSVSTCCCCSKQSLLQMATSMARPYQVVVWGATGFTGKLVCEHIARDYHGRIRWAMAGRDRAKLERVREALQRINPDVKSVPILTADATNGAAVGEMLKQTQVVLALAGPFAKYGSEVVAQAVEHGTHYCDTTGEVPWVKRMAARHHATAEQKGVKVVHCCGFDSIPSDLGVLMLAEHAEKQLGKKLAKAYGLVLPLKGGISGGTIASIVGLVEEEPMSELLKLSSDAYYLASAAQPKRGTDKPAPQAPHYIKEAKSWAGPWFMEGCNAKIVHYSNALRPKGPYGSDFHYTEALGTGAGWSGWIGANTIAFGMLLLGVGFAVPPLRWALKQVLPGPGQGPTEEQRMSGSWKFKLFGVTEEAPGVTPTVITGECSDKRDPGYWSTSRMLLETGLCLALDNEAVSQTGVCRSGGVLTPATACGPVLIDRLRAAGFTWKVDGPAKQ